MLRYEGGVRGLYKGLIPTLAREVPGNAAYFSVYNWMKRWIANLQVSSGHALSETEPTHMCLTNIAAQGLESTAELGPGALVAAGGLAGASFWGVCYVRAMQFVYTSTDTCPHIY